MILKYCFPLLFGAVALASAQTRETTSAHRPFTVRDSIEMKVFTDPYTRTPGATAKEAPDGRGFIVVTTQGDLETNTLKSCLWYFRRRDLDAFLDGKQSVPPQPQLLFARRGVPEAKQMGSYGSLITDVQWSADSNSLTFLVERTHGIHHLYQRVLSQRIARDLTPRETGDIISPNSQGTTLTYLVSSPQVEKQRDRNRVSTVLTGHSIFDILFPRDFPYPPGIERPWRLRVKFQGETRTFPSGKEKFFPYTATQIFTPSISPDGAYVLTVVPVEDVPSSWRAYQTANPVMKFIPANSTSDRSGRHTNWPWQYALIDLKTGTITPLFAAPTPYLTYWGGPFEAKWSRSGTTILITQTYLPLDEAQIHNEDSVPPCAIAEYSVRKRSASCLATAPLPDKGEALMSANYDASGHVVAKWSVRGTQVLRIYERGSKTWIASNVTPPAPRTMELIIHQDIDVPPTLWVRRGKDERLLWDINPQLQSAQFGRAHLYQWADSSGYTWRGGLVLPLEPAPAEGYPLVIQTHGFYNAHEFLVDGAFTSGNAAQPLASSGIAVLQMEDRSGRHSRPSEEEAEDEIRGIESAIEQLTKEHVIDRSKVGIQGFSRTSWYVERALERSPELYKAALIIDGVDQSYVSDVLFVPGYPRTRIDTEGSIGSPPFGGGLTKWLRNAAGFNLDKVTTPVRLEAHGTTFSILGEWEIYSILEQQGKPVDFIDIVHGQHILQRPKDRYVSQQGALDWFRFWLQDYEDADPNKVGEYLRWNEMRATSNRAEGP